jgi:hypothetical protein
MVGNLVASATRLDHAETDNLCAAVYAIRRALDVPFK